MPPEAAAAVADVAPAAAPAPVVVPPADQPPAPKPKLSFEERWKAVESAVDDSAETEAPATTPGTPAAKAPEKPAPAAAPSDRDAKFSQLKTIAEELGLVVDNSGIASKEAIGVREAKRKNLEWRAQQEAEFSKRNQEWQSQHGEKLKRAQAVFEAYERLDPDGIAQALGAKDFNDFNASLLKRAVDPNYLELRKVQQELEERRTREAKEQEEAAARNETERRTKIERDYIDSLSAQCKNSADPLVREMHDDPHFLRDIFRIQKENWDDDLQRTVSVEEAIKMAPKGVGTTLGDWHKKQADRYARIFGAAPPAAASTEAAPATPAPGKNGKKPAPKTAVVPSTSTGASGGAPKKVSEMSAQEWAERKRRAFEEAKD